MLNLAMITASRELCEKLVEEGLRPNAFFWHYQDGETWKIAQFKTPDTFNMVPAWTKQELDFMIGNDLPKPDLFDREKASKQDLDQYPLFTPTKQYTFKNGADASAQALLLLISLQMIDPIKASERHDKHFNR